MRRPLVVGAIVAAVAAAAVAAAAVAVVLVVGGGGGEEPDFRGSRPPEGVALPAFTLPDHRGEEVSSAALGGKVVLVTFLDSQCAEACPIVASQIARALDGLPPGERSDVVAVAFSTDPDEDTRAAVERFLARTGAEGSLRYLVGPVEALRPLWKEFGIVASLDTGSDMLHSAPLRVYGRDGRWVSTLHAGADLTTENLRHDVRAALAAA